MIGDPVSVHVSEDFDAYAEGRLDVRQVRCVLCTTAPCACPEFGSPEYLELVDRLHGTNFAGGQR
ncbi:hypothetical protein ABZY58_11290 [Micromonospora tulbaghiae]|uniref:hypothetical protein n=1 Tax=Micromonospora tulbaghiae TaxID=479978 RepID=UPI0033A9085D